MSICDNLKGNLKFSSGKLQKILGSHENDSIVLLCLASICSLEVNSQSCTFDSNILTSHILKIDGLKGDDFFEVRFDKTVYTNFEIVANDGNNSIRAQDAFPFVAGIINLGEGNNDIFINAELGSEILVKGFRNMQGTKLHLGNSSEYKDSDLKVSLSNPELDTYDVELGNNKILQILNDYSLAEESIVLKARAAAQLGKTLPEEFIKLNVPLYSAPELTADSLIPHIVFE